jgi:hypothetical protein
VKPDCLHSCFYSLDLLLAGANGFRKLSLGETQCLSPLKNEVPEF